jgi:hypothetical protein
MEIYSDKKESDDEEHSNGMSNTSDLLQSTRIRRSISCCDEMDRIFLGNRFNLLFHICPIFWLILLFKSK